jgi:hypothetical protein
VLHGAFGCGSSKPAPDGSTDAGILPGSDAASDGAPGGPCGPTLPPTFTPVWHPPKPFGQSACMAADFSAYYDACLTSPIDADRCTAFTNAHSACVNCIVSDEGDAMYGPLIWHQNRAFFTLNIAGCLAHQLNDVSPRGCGAAFQAIVQCKQSSCTGCFDPTDTTFNSFLNCEGKAGPTVCQPFTEAESESCHYSHDPNTTTGVCVDDSVATRDQFLRMAPLFCGPPM